MDTNSDLESFSSSNSDMDGQVVSNGSFLGYHRQESYSNKGKNDVFTHDYRNIFELLISHELPQKYCDSLFEKKFDGSALKKLQGAKDIQALQKECKEKFDLCLNDNDSRHLLAIINKYSKEPCQNIYKLMSDCVHGQIKVHPLLFKIIDTPEFHRLHKLKQLGSLFYVFSCAMHTRFEHCIGTSHLAYEFVKTLKENQPSLGITSSDMLCVRIAGLCHDLGHGPFSHLFEDVLEELNVHSWKHELASLMIFDKMFKENNLKDEFESYGLFEHDVTFIKDLIYVPNVDPKLSYKEQLMQYPSFKHRGPDKSFLYEIVSNRRNGIDVDKFDYFQRDCLLLGFRNLFDHRRYMNCARVIKLDDPNDNFYQICQRDKEFKNSYELFHVREYLTRRAYKHENSANLLLCEALVKANKYFKFSEILENKDIDRYLLLTDEITYEIERSNHKDLIESRKLLEKLQRRQMYKYITCTKLKDTHDREKIREKLKKYICNDINNNVKEDSVVITFAIFNYGAKNKNPIDNLRFYSKSMPDKAFKINKDKHSQMLLNFFEDTYMRIYSKNSDPKVIQNIRELFIVFCKENGLPGPYDEESF